MRNCLLALRLLLREKLLWGFLAAFLALNLLLVHLNLPGANAGWELDALLPELLGMSDALLYNKLLSAVLAEKKIGIFAVSTYNTDYIFVKQEHFARALDALAEAGYTMI